MKLIECALCDWPTESESSVGLLCANGEDFSRRTHYYRVVLKTQCKIFLIDRYAMDNGTLSARALL